MLTLQVQVPGQAESLSIELINTATVEDLKISLSKQLVLEFQTSEMIFIYEDHPLDDDFRLNFLPFVPTNPLLELRYPGQALPVPSRSTELPQNTENSDPQEIAQEDQTKKDNEELKDSKLIVPKTVPIKAESFENEFISQPPTPKFCPPKLLSFGKLTKFFSQAHLKIQETNSLKLEKFQKELKKRQGQSTKMPIADVVENKLQLNQHQESVILNDAFDDRNPNNETVLNLLDTIKESQPPNYVSEERKLEIQREQEKLLREQVIKERQAKLEQLQLEKEKRRQVILERLEEEKQRREMSEKVNKDGNKIIKQVKREMQMEEQERQKRQEQLLLEELDRRKKALAEKKLLAKPMSLQNILEHAKKHETDLKILMMERQNQRVEDEIRKQQLSVPKSKYHIQIEQQDKEQRDKDKRDKEIKKQLVVRKQRYAEVIKDMFLPKKKISIQEAPSSYDNEAPITYQPVRQHASTNYTQSPNKGRSKEMYSTKNTTTSTVKERFKFPKASITEEKPPQLKIIKSTLPPLVKRKKSPANLPPVAPQIAPLPTKRPDYLTDMRLKRDSQPQRAEDIERQQGVFILSSLKKSDNQTLQTLIRKMDTEVSRKEQLIKNIEHEEEVNELYVQSIKAKLALLSK